MKIDYTGRNFTVSPAIKKHILEHFHRVEEFLNGSTHAHVILSVAKHQRALAEIVVNWQHHTLTAKADTADMYASTTQAIEKLRRQIVKLRGKLIDRHHHAPAVTDLPVQEDTPPKNKRAKPGKGPAAPQSSEVVPRIIRSRRYAVKPMTPEEALLLVADTPEQFLVFRDADTEQIGVLYKRKDGNYGLIEP